ncbi:hypothetical protein CFP56_013415 [Quercus suber]|uniref:Uncharacterized protein n=1 Tax=Quercus suber TaxID=58331 RepID=A0AAW0KUE0_QUESU
MLGARNFVVFEIGAIGCLPVMLNTPQPMPPKTRFLDQVNSLVSIYNAKLAAKLNELGSFLKAQSLFLQKLLDLRKAPSYSLWKRYAAATQPSRTP